MSPKFIVNSLLLGRLLHSMDLDLRDPDEEIVVESKRNHLQVDESKPLIVECKEDFEFVVTAKQLLRLSKFLRLLEEQPVVLYYDQNRWLNIQNAVI